MDPLGEDWVIDIQSFGGYEKHCPSLVEIT